MPRLPGMYVPRPRRPGRRARAPLKYTEFGPGMEHMRQRKAGKRVTPPCEGWRAKMFAGAAARVDDLGNPAGNPQLTGRKTLDGRRARQPNPAGGGCVGLLG